MGTHHETPTIDIERRWCHHVNQSICELQSGAISGAPMIQCVNTLHYNEDGISHSTCFDKKSPKSPEGSLESCCDVGSASVPGTSSAAGSSSVFSSSTSSLSPSSSSFFSPSSSSVWASWEASGCNKLNFFYRKHEVAIKRKRWQLCIPLGLSAQ